MQKFIGNRKIIDGKRGVKYFQNSCILCKVHIQPLTRNFRICILLRNHLQNWRNFYFIVCCELVGFGHLYFPSVKFSLLMKIRLFCLTNSHPFSIVHLNMTLNDNLLEIISICKYESCFRMKSFLKLYFSDNFLSKFFYNVHLKQIAYIR